MDINEQLDFIQFRQDLIFNNTEFDRFIYEMKLTRSEYHQLLELMDEYRSLIDSKQPVYHDTFENEVYTRVPKVAGDYHFCEIFTQTLMESNRYSEVFHTLYGNMTKFRGS